jgi:uncharacterized Fe-S cluster-containing protein
VGGRIIGGTIMTTPCNNGLPGLNCGLCGYPRCQDLLLGVKERPEIIKRCVHLEASATPGLEGGNGVREFPLPDAPRRGNVAPGIDPPGDRGPGIAPRAQRTVAVRDPWRDSLGREFDFVLRHFPEDPGPREIIIPHNPILTRELDIQAGDVLIGRPLGMSCGCPITHCGVATAVDARTGVITWCVTGPLGPRAGGFKDLGYYIAEAYEGLIREARGSVQIGMRYFFQPEMCMLQWRHSGLVNYLNHTDDGLQVRVEGLWIG